MFSTLPILLSRLASWTYHAPVNTGLQQQALAATMPNTAGHRVTMSLGKSLRLFPSTKSSIRFYVPENSSHPPQLIDLSCVTAAHHFPPHSPVRITRNARRPQCPPPPTPIDFIQHGHHPRSFRWLIHGEQII